MPGFAGRKSSAASADAAPRACTHARVDRNVGVASVRHRRAAPFSLPGARDCARRLRPPAAGREGRLIDLSTIPPADPAVSKGREALRRCEAVRNGGRRTRHPRCNGNGLVADDGVRRDRGEHFPLQCHVECGDCRWQKVRVASDCILTATWCLRQGKTRCARRAPRQTCNTAVRRRAGRRSPDRTGAPHPARTSREPRRLRAIAAAGRCAA